MRSIAPLPPTRGAAVAVARIDAAAQVVRFVGVGNISALLVQPAGARHMVSHNGTAGHVAPRIREFTYEFTSDPLVILHSDGLATRWDIAAYPGLTAQHPSLIAGVLLRDHRRSRDDASVVAMRASELDYADEHAPAADRDRRRDGYRRWCASGRDVWRSSSASMRRTRRASPLRFRRSSAMRSNMRGGGQIEFRLTTEAPNELS